MLSHEQLQIVQNLQFLSQCPIQIFSGTEWIPLPESPLSSLSIRIDSPFLCDSRLLESFTAMQACEPQILYEGEHIHYGIWKQSEELTFLVGPTASGGISRDEIRSYMQAHHIHDTKNFYISIGTIEKTLITLALLRFLSTGRYVPPVWHKDPSFPEEQIGLSAYSRQMYSLTNAEYTTQHIPYQFEEQVMSIIKKGDLAALKSLSYDKITNYTLGKVAFSTMKEAEYQAVLQTSLMQRAAIDGGLDPYDAYDMGDLWLQKISLCKSIPEIRSIQIECMIGFCKAVHNVLETRKQSQHIEKCKHFVARHLNKPFHLQDAADYVGISPQYLSELFSRHEKQTLKSYIQRERINAAKNMLKYSDYSISEIASYLTFYTQSHFGAVFKKYEGISPSEYRRNVKR